MINFTKSTSAVVQVVEVQFRDVELVDVEVPVTSTNRRSAEEVVGEELPLSPRTPI
jgi:hypothetical protein